MSKPIVDERAARRARFVLGTFAAVCSVVFAVLVPSQCHAGESTADADVLASYRGAITSVMLDEWQQCRRLLGGRPQSSEHDLEDLLVELALATRWTAVDGSSSRPMLDGLVVKEAAAGRLRAAVAEASSPSNEEVRRVWEEDPTAFDQPRRWRLSNITLKVDPAAGEGGFDSRRNELEAIRARVTAGEDFAVLAREHSESATAHRGGVMGFVTLARLRPEIAEVVRGLEIGELSPVVETADSVVLLLCGGVAEAESPSFEKIGPRLRTEIKSRRFTDQWESLAAELRSGTEIRLTGFSDGDLNSETVIGEFRPGNETREFTVEELETFMVHRGTADSFKDLDESKRREILREWLDREVQARESRVRGLFTDDDEVMLTGCLERRRRAQSVVNRMAAGRIAEPTDEEIERAYNRNRDRFFEPRRLEVDFLRLPLEKVAGTETIDAFEVLAEGLRTGRVRWDEAATSIPEVEVSSWGWLTDKQLWLRGPGVERAMRGIEVGDVSPMAQEGRQLYVFKLLDEEPKRQLLLPEASPAIRAATLASRRKAVGAQIRAEILDQIELRTKVVSKDVQQVPSAPEDVEVEP